MTKGQRALQIAISVVFILAFCAFLYASIHHVSKFYDNFEPSGTAPDIFGLSGSTLLAIALDLTALMLTLGIMNFGATMTKKNKGAVWAFIIFLTALSWFINYQYAARYQGVNLTKDDVLRTIDPIIASSFAALNLAYAFVSELFTAKKKTIAELQAELAEKTQ